MTIQGMVGLVRSGRNVACIVRDRRLHTIARLLWPDLSHRRESTDNYVERPEPCSGCGT